MRTYLFRQYFRWSICLILSINLWPATSPVNAGVNQSVSFCWSALSVERSSSVLTLALQPEVSNSSESVVAEQELTPEQKQQQKMMVTISWILLAGVCILGFVVMLIVITLGARARRLARDSSEKSGPGDSLWYFKNESRSKLEEEDEAEDGMQL